MRFAGVFAQGPQHRAPAQIEATRQLQRGQRVQGIVDAADAQGIDRHQATHAALGARRLWRVLLAAHRRDGLIEVDRLGRHQPGHALAQLQAHVAHQLGHFAAKAAHRHGIQRRHHVHGIGIIAVDDGDARHLQQARLAPRIGVHAAMPVQVILRHVQHDGRVGHQRVRGLELEAGQLQHPYLRQRVGIQRLHQRGQRGRADVAGGQHRQATGRDQVARQGGDGGLAVGAGHGQHARAVFAGLGQFGQRPREQFDLADDLDAAGLGLTQQLAGRRAFGRESRADDDLAHAIQQRDVERRIATQAVLDLGLRQRVAQRVQSTRLRARVGHPQAGALAGAPACGGHARLAQSEDQDERRIGAGGFHRIHRNFRVERPISTSIMLMIQKRTTTWVSFQPPTSK